MQKFETLFVLQPGLSEEKVDEVVATFESIIPETSGTLLTTDKWGKRKLAYRVGDHWEGWYVRYEFEGTGDVQRELERRMGISDDVIRFLTTRVDPRMEAEQARAAEREQRGDGNGPPPPASVRARTADAPAKPADAPAEAISPAPGKTSEPEKADAPEQKEKS